VKPFLFGIFVTILGLAGCVYLFLRLGFLDPRANRSPSKWEIKEAMDFLDASVRRHAPQLRNPFPPSAENLKVGLDVYQARCAVCHGDRANPRSAVGLALYPPAPQFLESAPDMPEYQNFFIIRNGIRWTGMPGWRNVLSENEIWQLTTFLTHIDHLPPDVEWNPAPSLSGQHPMAKTEGVKPQ